MKKSNTNMGPEMLPLQVRNICINFTEIAGNDFLLHQCMISFLVINMSYLHCTYLRRTTCQSLFEYLFINMAAYSNIEWADIHYMYGRANGNC